MSESDRLLELLADSIADKVLAKVTAKMQGQSGEPLAYSVAQAAVRLGLSESTVRNMIRDREIAVVRRGTRVLIARKALEQFLEKNAA